jgi:hypothetical protein
LLLITLAAEAQAPAVTFKFVTYNVPGAALTALGGINNAGVVVGTYTDKSGNTHCFTDNGTTLTTIDDPNGTNSSHGRINNHGAVVGTYTSNETGNDAGFLYEGGKYTDIIDPLNNYGTDANAINDSGVITGSYLVDIGEPCGFVLKKGVFTTITYSGSIKGITIPTAINNSGTIVAFYLTEEGTSGSVMLSGKKWAVISPPNSKQSIPQGINNKGNISFDAYSSNTTVVGSLLDAGVYTSFKYPAAGETYGGVLNDKGMMAGSYQKKKSLTSAYSGYIATYQ